MKPLYSIKLSEYFIVSLVLLCLIVLFHETNIDRILIDPFFSDLKPLWPWRDAFITEKVFHKGGVKLIILVALTIVGLRVFSKKVKQSRDYKIFIYHTFLSALFSMIIVKVLKKSTPILCPWSLKEYGGHKVFISFSQIFDQTLSAANCFPAGHSSAAFAWICIYFSYQLVFGQQKRSLLIPGLVLGIIYGVTQQMRGAHFASHDLATVLICWLVAGAMALIFQKISNLSTKIQRNYEQLERFR